MSKIDEKLRQMGYDIKPTPPPTTDFVQGYRAGNTVYLSGAGPRGTDGSIVLGKVGKDLTVEQGYDAARLCAVNLLANLKGIIGDLDKVKHIARLFGMVNATPDFIEHAKVINGASELFWEAFGEKGQHARAAVGMSSLPNGMAVEVELIVELEE